ncbi:MAG: cysteine hydrolase [Variovorax sp.]|nr:cysteine hydrolase [Variovorax sp.]
MKSIYLILDMQNDLVHADGPNGKSPLGEQVRNRRVVENTAAALKKARTAGVAVGFVRVGFSPEYQECPKNSPVFSGAPKAGLFKLGSFGTEIHPALEQKPGDVQVVKHRVSPFYSTTLMAQLSAAGIQRIYCSGVSTQAVVQATVRDGHDRDFEMVVLEDACCAHSEEEHKNSMGSIARFCRVTTSADVDYTS